MSIFESRELAVQPRAVSTPSPSRSPWAFFPWRSLRLFESSPCPKKHFWIREMVTDAVWKTAGRPGWYISVSKQKGEQRGFTISNQTSLPPPLLWYQTRLWTPSIFNLVLCSLSFGVVQVQLCTSLPSLISSIWKSSLLTFSKSNLIFCLNILFFFNVISQIGRLFPPTTSFQNSGIFS